MGKTGMPPENQIPDFQEGRSNGKLLLGTVL